MLFCCELIFFNINPFTAVYKCMLYAGGGGGGDRAILMLLCDVTRNFKQIITTGGIYTKFSLACLRHFVQYLK